MTDTLVMFNPVANPGSKFMSAAVIEEIGFVAPSSIGPGALTSSMFAAGSVTAPALAANSVTATAIAAGAVTAAAMAVNSVTGAALAPGAVTPAAAGVGMPTATDQLGNPVALSFIVLTAAQYAAIATPNPNTLYFCYTS
jgi:trimeric autotransporter adhesin